MTQKMDGAEWRNGRVADKKAQFRKNNRYLALYSPSSMHSEAFGIAVYRDSVSTSVSKFRTEK